MTKRKSPPGIYCIENLVNGKKYIGQGIDVIVRMGKTHKESPILYAAIKKYGRKNFKRYVLIYCEEWELTRLEIACIKSLGTHVSEGGYNVSWGGDAPMTGRKHSDKTKELMSKSSPRLKGLESPNYGKHPSEKTRAIWKEQRRNHHHSEETKRLIGIGNSKENSPFYEKFGKDSRNFGKKFKNASSKYYGVYKHVKKVKNTIYIYWDVILQEKRIRKNVGSYKTELEAARAYDKYVVDYNLDRPLNFPEDNKNG